MSREPATEPAGTRERTGTARLRIDPSACDGVGICAHVAAALITVDVWGYPLLSSAYLDDRTLPQARAAVRACPHRALFLD